MVANKNQVWLNPKQAAEFLSRSVPTLARWRSDQSKGPRWYGGGRGIPVRYKSEDLEEWLDSIAHDSEESKALSSVS